MEEDAEKKAVVELKQELQRVRVLIEALTVSDDDDELELQIADSAIHTLRALKELKLKQSDGGLIELKNLGIQQPPQEFLCPISGLLMTDPIVADCGQTYDNTSIIKYVREGYENCPGTDFLTANHILKENILSWCIKSQFPFFHEKDLEQMSVLELKRELLRVMGGLVADEDDGDHLEFVDVAVQTLCGLREIKMNQEPPQEFLCPFSRTLMIDPVVAASGQTFDEAHIENWLKQGNRKCPKTDQLLSHTVLIRNQVIKKMIAKWCRARQLDPPTSRHTRGRRLTADASLMSEFVKFPYLSHTHQTIILRDVRLLTARLPFFRLFFSDISPLLTQSMIDKYDSDAAMYNEVLATILNICCIGDNSEIIIVNDCPVAIPFLVDALSVKNSVENRGYAAAALWGLSAVDPNKIEIGEEEALRPLIKLLELGHPFASREAAGALLSLCTWFQNKERALSEGVIDVVLNKLDQPELLDMMLEILALFSRHPWAVEIMDERGVVPRLFRVIGETTSAHDEENSVVVICAIGSSDKSRLRKIANVENAARILYDVSYNGNARARRKAIDLLLRIRGMELPNVRTN